MTKYNIIMVNPDQMRGDYTTSSGHKFIETKNLSKLENMGVAFKNAFTTCPMCGPTRTSFITGQYALEHQVRNYGGTMPEDYPNALNLLKENGYRLALFGKDHIIGGNAIGKLYDEGEDICIGNMDNHPNYINSYDSGVLEKDSEFNITERLTTQCLDFIDRQVKEDQPFFATINFQDPHPYFACPEPYASMFESEQFELPKNFRTKPTEGETQRLSNWRVHSDSQSATEEDFKKAMAMYCGQIRYVDDQLGRVIDKLTELNQLDKTIIVFWSDHGEFLGDFGVTHKGIMFYDCLVNVPLFIYDPSGKINKNQRDDLVELIDVFPSILSILGIQQLPKNKGVDLASKQYQPRKDVFAEGGIYAEIPKEPLKGLKIKSPGDPTQWGAGSMLRTKDFKLVVYVGDKHELFDLKYDPKETNNLFNNPKYSDIQSELMLRLLNRQQNQGQPPEFSPKTLEEIANRNRLSYPNGVRTPVKNFHK